MRIDACNLVIVVTDPPIHTPTPSHTSTQTDRTNYNTLCCSLAHSANRAYICQLAQIYCQLCTALFSITEQLRDRTCKTTKYAKCTQSSPTNRHDKTRIIKDRQNLTRSFMFLGPAHPEESPVHHQEVLVEVFYFVFYAISSWLHPGEGCSCRASRQPSDARIRVSVCYLSY